jgi:hypothetical protein
VVGRRKLVFKEEKSIDKGGEEWGGDAQSQRDVEL